MLNTELKVNTTFMITARSFISAFLLIALLITAFARNGMWFSEGTLWSDVAMKSPSRQRAYSNLCSFHSKSNNAEAGIKSCGRAIELKQTGRISDLVVAYVNRGALYVFLGNFFSAEQDYLAAVELEPNNRYAWNNLGNVYAKRNEAERAIESYGRAILSNSSYASPYYNRAVVLAGLKRLSSALEDFSRVIELNPSRTEAVLARAQVRRAMGDVSGAAEDFEKACAMGVEAACGEFSGKGMR